ncbi:MAG TPA: ABC transporter permease [Actinocrinis sp.]|jgi:branched-chain amino acid transport system permease protein|uniref:ABC transporter permease subunit n=1 Tax=Actinocrinis sp. TaxID=1920516 RepID=UPI002DDCA538|nr:ABC transporter permease [Actinocrinis sp.]HEV3169383.1 ABC transporter permease [Actinocrinis sp.]
MSAGAGQLAVAGLGIGAVAGLSGLGVITTYRVTGVLNVAFGAIGMAAAFLLDTAVHAWGIPTGVAAAVIILVCAPLFGVLLDFAVFNPLQRRAAGVGAQLTAGFGVTVLLVGIATVVWGSGARTDAPSLLPQSMVRWGGLSISDGVFVELGLLAVIAAGLILLTRGSAFGVTIRAVVDDRRLAELSGLPARGLGRAGWAIGSALAAAAGMLLAPQLRLDPVTFTLLLFETLGVVVAARLAHPLTAVGVALATGIAQAELIGVHLSGRPGEVLGAVRSNLFVAVLLVAVWSTPAFHEARERTSATLRRTALAERVGGWWPVVALAVAAALLRPGDVRTAQQIPALAVVLLSFRVLHEGGLISLGQTAFVGTGALIAAWEPRLGLLEAALGGALLGAVLALPVARKRPLHLALTTLAIATAASRFVFEQPLFTPPPAVNRPGLLSGDRAYLVAEAVGLGLVVLLLVPLEHGALGRRLAAIRDSEPAARMLGIPVERTRVLVFVLGGAVAAFGGALWCYADLSFDPATYDPLRGLIWLAAATAVGITSAPSLILAAVGMVVADTVVPGASAIIVGVAALTAPWLRGESVEAVGAVR